MRINHARHQGFTRQIDPRRTLRNHNLIDCANLHNACAIDQDGSHSNDAHGLIHRDNSSAREGHDTRRLIGFDCLRQINGLGGCRPSKALANTAGLVLRAY